MDEDNHCQNDVDGQAYFGSTLRRHEEDEGAHSHELCDGESKVVEVVERSALHRHEVDDVVECVLATREALWVLLTWHTEQIPLDVRVVIVEQS